jgi:hypothetical protein
MQQDPVRWLPDGLPPRAYDAAAWRKVLVASGWWVTPIADDTSFAAAGFRELHAAVAHLETMEDALARARAQGVARSDPSRAQLVGLACLGCLALVGLGVAIEANATTWIRVIAGGTVLVPVTLLATRRYRRARSLAVLTTMHATARRDVETALAALRAEPWTLETEVERVGFRPHGSVAPTAELGPSTRSTARVVAGGEGDGPGLDGVEPLPAPWDAP